jgi:cation diffusion facilitator CzcD-associated flavoprotein CzcO
VADPQQDVDVVVIGAGFSGLYLLHQLRELGFSVRAYETGDGVGGTWYWNRYPGARCDVESIDYSFSFSPEIEQDWDWSELMPSQPEVERYLNYVCDRLDLRRDIRFDTRVVAAVFDERRGTWTVTLEGGEEVTCRFLVGATGCLSAPLEPDIAGIASFEGVRLFTNRFPSEGFDFSGQRVAVIGTGSSGVQSIPVIAEQAATLHVFQRSAAYTFPSNIRPLLAEELAGLKAQYREIRQGAQESFAGGTRLSALNPVRTTPTKAILETPWNEQLQMLDEHSWFGVFAWTDSYRDYEANRAATALYAEMIRRVVHDPETAASLVPNYPFGCKRPCVDVGYFETYNRDTVTLVDLAKEPIVEITPAGITTEDHDFEFDVIVFATGFDAMTGALRRIDIRGRDGQSLAEVWAETPAGYLGLQVAGFPNLFTVTGPGSPSVLTNMVTSIELHVEWIAACLAHLRAHGLTVIEAEPEAQAQWIEHSSSLAEGLLITHPTCTSWYLGANVPGKRRVYMPYVGGHPAYRARLEECVAAGYEGFRLT